MRVAIGLVFALFGCALQDGQPCSYGTDCPIGYLCYWQGNEGCNTSGKCHRPSTDTCNEPPVLACGCDHKASTRAGCGDTLGYTSPVSDEDAAACVQDGGGAD